MVNHPRYSVRPAKWLLLWITVAAIRVTFRLWLGRSGACGIPAEASASMPQQDPPGSKSGNISGTVVDPEWGRRRECENNPGTAGSASTREALSDSNGYFLFLDIAPGPFQISFTASGFATVQASGVLQPGENYIVPQITLAILQCRCECGSKAAPVRWRKNRLRWRKRSAFWAFSRTFMSLTFRMRLLSRPN